MPSDKRNQFLDAGDSDDDLDRGSESEDDLQKGGRSAKRRRVEHDSDGSGSEGLSDGEGSEVEDGNGEAKDDEDGGASLKKDPQTASEDTAKENPTGDNKEPNKQDKKDASSDLPGVTKPLTKKNLITTEAAIRKSGVIYLSRIPPFMKPHKLRSLLEPYGKINRIFLAPEDPAAHSRRVRAGGNKKRSYTEGWVEFVKKKDAKKACDLLNAQIIGGKKGSWYHDDVWCMKYLKGFKWYVSFLVLICHGAIVLTETRHHLTEQIAAENAERAARMRAEIARSTRENKEFVRNIEKAKVLNGIEAKKAAKQQKKTFSDDGEGTGGDGEKGGRGEEREDDVPEVVDTEKKRRRTFKQIPLAKKRKGEEVQQSEQVQRVLSKIF
jgi:ESF2/ABP1 family protein